MTTPHPLTRNERQVLARVSRHFKTNGWAMAWAGLHDKNMRLVANWGDEDGNGGRFLHIWALTEHGTRIGTKLYASVTTVQQAIDLAVASGLLPAKFSTAFRAGFDHALTGGDPQDGAVTR